MANKSPTNAVPTSQDLNLRLCSIYHDSKFIEKLLSFIGSKSATTYKEEQEQQNTKTTSSNSHSMSPWPVIANERAGSWYCLPYIEKNKSHCESTHFKSTDGHAHIYNFSLKRMNLDFMEAAAQASRKGQCAIVVDASKYKILPDSFNATLPIWCCVLNRVAEYFYDKRKSQAATLRKNTDSWDTNLYVPSNTPPQEYNDMRMILSDRVQSVIDSHVILNPDKFIKTLHKPLRCFWIHNNKHSDVTDNMEQVYQEITNAMDSYICILCVNCSDSTMHSDEYIPGAGDDEQSWSLGLTPSLFWYNHKTLLKMSSIEHLSTTIQTIVDEARMKNEEWFRSMDHTGCYLDTKAQRLSDFYDALGHTGISIGSRRAGRPPECWNDFDAIVNVTTVEYYDEISSGWSVPQNKYYLQLPIEEGKRDKTEFERWLPIALIFVATHAITNKHRVLIHCAQGMDRSAGIAIACICMFCLSEKSDLQDATLNFHSWCTLQETCMDYQSMTNYIKVHVNKYHDTLCETTYKYSGVPKPLVEALLDSNGKHIFFSYAHYRSKWHQEYFATKDTVRIALLYIQQYRKKASPTRKTMQKIHRFFMSGETHAKCV